jgi:hypothetical protein
MKLPYLPIAINEVVLEVPNPRVIPVSHGTHDGSLPSSSEVCLQSSSPRVLNTANVPIVCPDILKEVLQSRVVRQFLSFTQNPKVLKERVSQM